MMKMIMLIAATMSIATAMNLTALEFKAVFPDVPQPLRTANHDALVAAAISLGIEFVSIEQKAAFLGSVAFNTRDLASHSAACVTDDTCDCKLFDTTCNPKSATVPAGHYFPRSAMMVSFLCGYSRVDAILAERKVKAMSVAASPKLLSENLYYSYLASLAVWTDKDNSLASCMSMTATNVSSFAVCQEKLNPWECTAAGQSDSKLRLQAIRDAALALGMTLPEMTGCKKHSVVKQECAADNTTAPAATVAPKTPAATVAPKTPAATVAPKTPAATVAPKTPAATVAPATPAATVAPATPAATIAPKTKCPTYAPATAPNAKNCSCVETETWTAPTCSASFPASFVNESMACGSISLDQFVTFYSLADNSSVVDLPAQFDALATACAIAQISQLDINQASFMLATTSFYSAALTDTGANVSDPFGFRGVMLGGGKYDYTLLTAFVEQFNMTCDLVSNGKLVHENMVLSWLSGLFYLEMVDSRGATALELSSVGEFGSAVAVIDPSLCADKNGQIALFEMVKAASAVLGQTLSCPDIFTTMCSAASVNPAPITNEDLVSSAERPTVAMAVLAVVILATL